MKIIACRAEDLGLLDAHLPSASAESHHAARFARQEAGESTYLLAWRDGLPVGHGEVRWHGCAAPEVRAAVARRIAPEAVTSGGPSVSGPTPASGCPEINGLAVAEHLRSQGIGTALIHAAEDLARARRLPAIGLGVDETNPRAAALYARLGYEALVPYVDRWSYVDRGGLRVECADACTFLVKRL
ncbi:GNAT family N-acetyltransferase [Streptomyces indicus]|uniref:Acetyltransferase (GNAT) family protein n=1 Tax=Streptomyces indicus TaxID=417292 RepID=A0A1G8XAX7_9ACTN|nr:GNAT family N-acetyltransferase [Streptomyces indicus]SDJ87527.1 Acetyltransferase (GNAT) family protein [Streptomyces indicus]